MSKALQVILVISLLVSLATSWALNEALEYERTKPLVFEAMADGPSGDVFTRIKDRPEDIARFPMLCPPMKML